MKRKFNWKVLLVLILILCFAVCMIACGGGGDKNPDKGKPNNGGGGNTDGDSSTDDGDDTISPGMAAINTLMAALDKTLPKEIGDAVSLTADFALDSDLVVKDGTKEVVSLAELGTNGLDLDVKLKANLSETEANNVINGEIAYDGKSVFKVLSKDNKVYLTDALTVTTDNPNTYVLDASALRYSMFLNDVPDALSELWSKEFFFISENTTISKLVSSLTKTIEGFGAVISPIVEKIIDVETTATDTATTYDLRLVIAKENDTLQGFAGAGIAELLAPILGGLGGDIAGVIDKVIPYVLGKGLSDLTPTAPYTKDDVNDVHIKFDVDKTTGALTGLSLSFETGKNVTTTEGGLSFAISNFSFKGSDNQDVIDIEAPTNAIPIGAEIEAKLDLSNDDLDLKATLQVVPNLNDGNMKVLLKSVALQAGNTTYNADDLCAEYALVEGSEDKYAIKVDLTALFKVAFKDELAGGVALADVLADNGIYTTQYYYEINIGEFLTNLVTKKYVLVGMAGTGSHYVYEYLWMDTVTTDTTVANIAAEIVKDQALCEKIFKSYGLDLKAEGSAYEAADFHVAVSDRWDDGAIKYVTVYPAADKRTVTFDVEGDEDIVVDVTAGDSFSELAKHYSAEKEGYYFIGWTGGPQDDIITENITVTPVFESADAKSLVDVYRYDVASKQYVIDSTSILACDVIEIEPAAIYNMTFDFWMQVKADGKMTKIDLIDENTTAIYPVYKTLNTSDVAITAEDDDSQIIAAMPKAYCSVDVLGLILDNVSTALNVIENQELTINQVVDIVSGISMLGIDGKTAEAKQEQVADWILYLTALGANTENQLFYNFYYNVSAPQDSNGNGAINAEYLKKAIERLSGAGKSYEKDVVDKYMSDLINYTAYYRFVAIYGNLTKTEVTENWQYGWTNEDWATYSAASGAAAKADAYKTISATKGIRVNKEALEPYKTNANAMIMQYINSYLNTEYTTLKDFLFADTGLKAGLALGRDANGLNLVITLKRGNANVGTLSLTASLIDGRIETTLDAAHTWDTAGMLDFRAWDMTLIKDANGDQAIDTTGWTAQDYTDFATQCVIGGDTITFRGQTYDYDASRTQWLASIASLLAKINAKMVEQPA